MDGKKPGTRKVRTGCLTCKLRRVKCDEAKPQCLRCRKSRKQCMGYAPNAYGLHASQASSQRSSSTSSSSGSESPHASVNLAVAIPGSRHEQRYLDFFRHRTLPNVNGGFHSYFWDKLILQMSASDPAIRHAVVALASIHEETESNQPLLIPEPYSYSTAQYVRSLSHLQDRINDRKNGKLEIILTCCILFTAFEAIRGNPSSAMLHLRNGLKMLAGGTRPTTSQPHVDDSVNDDLIPVFLRLNIQARSLLRPALPDYHHLTQDALADIPEVFNNLTQARDILSTLFNKGFSIFQSVTNTDAQNNYPAQSILSLSDDPPQPPIFSEFQSVSATETYQDTYPNHHLHPSLNRQPTSQPSLSEEQPPDSPTFTTDVFRPPEANADIAAKLASLTTQLAEWHAAYDRLLTFLSRRNSARSLTGSDLHAATLLKVHHLAAEIVLATCTDPGGLAFDSFHSQFSQLVALAADLISLAGWDQRPSFSIDMGVIAPLYFTVTSCREPKIRRQAVRLLRGMGGVGRREGAWDAGVAAGVGEWFVGVEEGTVGVDSGVFVSQEGVVQEGGVDEMELPELGAGIRGLVPELGPLGTVTSSNSMAKGRFGCWMAGKGAQGALRQGNGWEVGVLNDEMERTTLGRLGAGTTSMERGVSGPKHVKRRIRRLHAEVNGEGKWIKLVPVFRDEEELREHGSPPQHGGLEEREYWVKAGKLGW